MTDRDSKQKKSEIEKQQQIEALKHELSMERESHKKTKVKLRVMELENHAITQSTSYKVARILAQLRHLLRIAITFAVSMEPQRLKLTISNKKNIKRVYSSNLFTDAFEAPTTKKLAVVIHLYYTDMLPYFLSKLESLKSIDYDLYITITDKDTSLLDTLRQQAPDARIAVAPNCGRDVLPFMQVMGYIKDMGYSNVLKLHSKKSPHRADGAKWRDSIVDSLLPSDTKTVSKIIETLDAGGAIVGPQDQYVSMLVNFHSTEHHTRKLAKKILGLKSAEQLLRSKDEYGFFAGTMFWAHIDALLPVINNVSASDFEPELGQQDSTLAHALERMFSVIPELQGRDLFEIGDAGLNKINYHTTNIPEWSEINIKD